jgi:hypothetical protein
MMLKRCYIFFGQLDVTDDAYAKQQCNDNSIANVNENTNIFIPLSFFLLLFKS